MKNAIKNIIVIPLIYLAVTILLSLILLLLSFGISYYDSLFFFNQWNSIITGIFTLLPIITTLLVIWYAKKKHEINIKEKLKVKTDIKNMAICFAIGFSVSAILIYFFSLLSFTPSFSVNIIGKYKNAFISLIITCLIIPVCEEIEYRICSISIGEKYVSKTKAMILTSVLVGFLNSAIVLVFIYPSVILNSFFDGLFFTTFGLFTGYIYIATDNVYCSLGTNIGAELALFCLYTLAYNEKFIDAFYILTEGGRYILRTHILIVVIITLFYSGHCFKKQYIKIKETNE